MKRPRFSQRLLKKKAKKLIASWGPSELTLEERKYIIPASEMDWGLDRLCGFLDKEIIGDNNLMEKR